MNKITKKWWFYLIILLLFFIPTYASREYDPRKTVELIKEVLSNPLILTFPILIPIAKIIPIILIIGIIAFGNKMTHIFNFYVALLYLALAIFQTTAITDKYGLVIISGNFALVFVVAIFWIWEVIVKENDFMPQKQPLWKWWVVPLAFLAFWFPVDIKTISPDFSPIYLLTNESGLTYCMMTPVILTILILFYPNINCGTFRVSSFVGIIFGTINMIVWFILDHSAWWMGVMHIPLFIISIYAFIISNFNVVKKNPK